MSDAPFEVWLDEERQIVRQRMFREPSFAEFERLVAKTGECASRLRDPSDTRILVDGTWFGRIKKATRASALATLHRDELKRVAIVNTHRMVRVMIRFFNVVTGFEKTRAFDNETDALEWLQS